LTFGQTVLIPRIDYDRCQACKTCQAAKCCPRRALVRLDRDEPPYVEVTLCGGCGECILHCAHKAIQSPGT
jgi:MinD superfamily P-loop ATPase